jgi:hypothetical protein
VRHYLGIIGTSAASLVVCVAIFMVFMALRPAPAQSAVPLSDRGRFHGYVGAPRASPPLLLSVSPAPPEADAICRSSWTSNWKGQEVTLPFRRPLLPAAAGSGFSPTRIG